MDFNNLKRLLDEQNTWPYKYTFKFIVKLEGVDQVKSKLDGFDIRENISKNGNFISVTAVKLMNSSDEIIGVYKSMSDIKGVITL